MQSNNSTIAGYWLVALAMCLAIATAAAIGLSRASRSQLDDSQEVISTLRTSLKIEKARVEELRLASSDRELLEVLLRKCQVDRAEAESR